MSKYKFNTTPERSFIMSKIKSKNTKPELRLRKALYAAGLRYRVNVKSLPGTPDIVIKKYKLAIFVDGEFWHGKDWAQKREKIKSNKDFWIAKIEKNITRDIETNNKLKQLGYNIFRFWAKEVETSLGLCVKKIVDCYVNNKDGTYL